MTTPQSGALASAPRAATVRSGDLIALPRNVDADASEAVAHDGVLEVPVPAPEQEAVARALKGHKPT